MSLPNLKEFHWRKCEKSDKDFSISSPQWQLCHQNRNSPRSLCEHAQIFEPRCFVDERLDNSGFTKYTQDLSIQIVSFTFSFKWFLCFYFWAVIWAILLTCSLLCMSLRQLARTLLNLASSVRALLKPYGDTLIAHHPVITLIVVI